MALKAVILEQVIEGIVLNAGSFRTIAQASIFYVCTQSGTIGVVADWPAELIFEWDERKAASNLVKHRVSFLTAAEIFAGEILERIDDREDYGEVRLIALGQVASKVYRVVYTRPGEDLVRIISAQKASKDEDEIYHRATFS